MSFFHFWGINFTDWHPLPSCLGELNKQNIEQRDWTLLDTMGLVCGPACICMWTFSSFYYLNHTFLNNHRKTSTMTFIFEKKKKIRSVHNFCIEWYNIQISICLNEAVLLHNVCAMGHNFMLQLVPVFLDSFILGHTGWWRHNQAMMQWCVFLCVCGVFFFFPLVKLL